MDGTSCLPRPASTYTSPSTVVPSAVGGVVKGSWNKSDVDIIDYLKKIITTQFTHKFHKKKQQKVHPLKMSFKYTPIALLSSLLASTKFQ